MFVRFAPKSPPHSCFPKLEAVPVLVDETPTERIYRLKGYMITGPRPFQRVLVCEGYELRVPKESPAP